MSASQVQLPEADLKGSVTLEAAIGGRRSCRAFSDSPLSLRELGQVLWAAQGVTGRGGRRRAVPSAGGLYPLETFVAVGEGTVEGLAAGVYRYVPQEHALEPSLEGDVRRQVAAAALSQDFLARAPADILIAADYARTAVRYAERATRYVDMEAGHVGQNVSLQAEALGLGTVMVGAFRDEAVARVFQLPERLSPLYLMPVGHPR